MRFLSTPPVPSAVDGHAFSVPTYREVQPALILELRRARRYEQPLGLVLVGLRAPDPERRTRTAGGVQPVDGSVTPTVYGLLGSFLRNALRESDILCALPEALAFATILPGTDRGGAEQALERFGEGFRECAGFPLQGGVAAFPRDGITLEDVMDQAGQSWRSNGRGTTTHRSEARYAHDRP